VGDVDGGILLRVSILNLFVEEGGDDAGWDCFDDVVERIEMAGDAARGGVQSRSVVVVAVGDAGGIPDLGTGGGATHVCSPSWVRATGCRHVEHFTVGRRWERRSRDWSGGFFETEEIMRVFWVLPALEDRRRRERR
jgi:hypothetical protein